MGALNVTTSDMISLAIWVLVLGAAVYWAHTFRVKHREIIGNRKYFYALSAVVLLFCLFGIFGKGLNYGLDFTGGTILELGSPKMLTLKSDDIAQMVRDGHPGYDVTVQLGNELLPDSEGHKYQKILVRVRGANEQVSLNSEEAAKVRAELEQKLNVGPLANVAETSIGPTISSELKTGAIKALIIACILQLIYITFRFGNQLRFGVSSVLAVIHDAIVMVGFYAWSGLPVDSSFVAALLTITSYSLMDTVVVFDRIREHQHNDVDADFAEITNRSVCETMTRSVNAALTTILVCICLYYIGGESLKGFAFALLVGVVTGGYSSIFFSSPLVVDCDTWANKRDALREEELRREAAEKAAKGPEPKTSSRRPVARPRKSESEAAAAEGGSSAPAAAPRARRRVKGMLKKKG